VKKVLVTGGTGFVGSHVVEVLAQRGMQPVIATRAPLEKNFQWEWVEVDYLNKDSVDAAVKPWTQSFIVQFSMTLTSCRTTGVTPMTPMSFQLKI